MNAQAIDRAWIAARIPHQGSMCLLDRVQAWDETRLHAVATSHHSPGNPLRSLGALNVWAGIEYAAQAMAVHGALTLPAGERPKQGFLTSARDVKASARQLDTVQGELHLHVERQADTGATVLYAFALRDADGAELLSGRATVMLDATRPARS